jgi:arylsulfatase A-like enzyme
MRSLLLFVCALAAGAAGAATPAAPARPNIVVLLADDWGFSDVGAFGGEIATPNLDALARRGMRFSNFHVSASCSPTRSMLLTGVDNHRNGVGNMRETIPQEHLGKPGYLTALSTNVVTVASLLRDSGYHTYVAGKWHVGREPHNRPDQRGFEHSIIQADSGSDNWETDKRYLDLSDQVYWYEDGKTATMPHDYYSSQFFVDRTIAYIDAGAKDAAPFFAYVAFQANHIPVQAPRRLIDKYRDAYHDGWSTLRAARRARGIEQGVVPADAAMVEMASTTDWNALAPAEKDYQARRMQVYAAMAEAMDEQVGRLVAHLKQSGQYDNTVFVFMSDNGPEASDPYRMLLGRLWLDWHYTRDIDSLGGKGAYSILGPSWASAAAAPLATYKFYAGEGGIRVPLIIAGVPGTRGGGVATGLAHVNDIAPTLLQLAGLAPGGASYRGQPVEPMTGRSLLPVLTGAATRTHDAGEPIGYELSGNQALFKGDLKLVMNIAPVGDGRWHLYDIARDPGETRDLQVSLPQAFQAMQADYAAYAKANGVLPMPPGYEPVHQVLVNALYGVYVPRYRSAALVLLVLLAVACAWLWRRRRRRT